MSTPQSPSQPVTQSSPLIDRYQRAAYLMQGAQGVRKLARNTSISPHWVGHSDCFWYTQETEQGIGYQWVDAQQQRRGPAFDHQQLAAALAEITGEACHAEQLPISDLVFDDSGNSLRFSAMGARWQLQHCRDPQAQQLSALTDHTPAAPGIVSPNGAYRAFIKDYNLWLQDLNSGEQRALTTDGDIFYRYGCEPTVFGYIAAPLVDIAWSPDSSRLISHLIDTRKLPTAPAVVEYVPKDGSLRPRCFNAERKLALPGDAETEQWQLLSIDVQSGELTYAQHRPLPMVYPVYQGFYHTGRGCWAGDSRHAYFIDQQLDGTEACLLRWDTHTGATHRLLEEEAELVFNAIPTSHTRTVMQLLPQTEELIWYSERSGWAHLYLYDLQTGALKNPITQGDWLVRNLLHIDPQQRSAIIQTGNRSPGRNPYYRDICRVDLDTGELTPLIASEHNYQVADQSHNTDVATNGVSPTGRYLVCSRSRINTQPETLLLDSDGTVLMTLEQADLSAMPAGWQWPEPMLLKGDDGETDIYGIIYRPSDFDPAQRYPVVDLSWGHSPPVSAFSDGGMLDAMAWAELGFIVVKCGNRGGGLRHRAFRETRNPKQPYYGKADCVAAIRQMAEQYPYMDLSRVGIASRMLYPEALSGLLIHPDFYHVGVDISPMTDPRLMPQIGNFSGGTAYPPHEDFADKLKGKLLLIHGMMEDVVLVAGTFRLVESLQKANKRFDMLMLPNVDHMGPLDYANKCSWDYLVEHLLGEEPPEEV